MRRFGGPAEFGHVKPAASAASIAELEQRYGAVIERYGDGDFQAIQLENGRIYSRLGDGAWLMFEDYARNNVKTRWKRFLAEMAG